MVKAKRKTETKPKLVSDQSDEPIDLAPDTYHVAEVMEAHNAESRPADSTNVDGRARGDACFQRSVTSNQCSAS